MDRVGFSDEEEKGRFECDARERAMLDGSIGGSQQRGSGDFSIGSAVWPGTSKLIEEQGELLQVLGKLMATGGDTKHWSGDLREKLVEELADVKAAIMFFETRNLTREENDAVSTRTIQKLKLFQDWHASHTKVDP